MAFRGGPALAMNEHHMRRVLASECVDGVEPDPALVRRWSTRTFDSYAALLVRRGPAALRERGRRARPLAALSGHEHLRAAMDRGRGIVMALPHVGSWEWGGAWLGLEHMPMTAVVERLEPEELFEWFIGQAGRHGPDGGAAGRRLEFGPAAGAQGERDRRPGQ